MAAGLGGVGGELGSLAPARAEKVAGTRCRCIRAVDVFPIGEEELGELAADIKTNGLHQPVVVARIDGEWMLGRRLQPPRGMPPPSRGCRCPTGTPAVRLSFSVTANAW